MSDAKDGKSVFKDYVPIGYLGSMLPEHAFPVLWGSWWCQNCRCDVPHVSVTFTERHMTCGTPVHWMPPALDENAELHEEEVGPLELTSE